MDRRARLAALVIGVVLALFLVGWAVGTIGGGGWLGGRDEADARPSGLPPGWASLEPLLPLAPGLKEIAAMKRSAAGGASKVLGARTDGDGALRLRALPASSGAPSGPAVRRSAEPRGGRLVPTGLVTTVTAPVDRIVDVRRLLRRPFLGDLNRIIDDDLSGLPGGTDTDVRVPQIDPIDIPRVEIPPIGPFPGTGPVPGGNPLPGGNPIPGDSPLPGGSPLPGRDLIPGGDGLLSGGGQLDGDSLSVAATATNVTVGDLGSDSRFDVLLVSSGSRVIERYVFRDSDVAGLAAQINLRSGLLAADTLRDGQPLAYVAAAPVVAGGAKAAGSAGDSSAGTERGDRPAANRGRGEGGGGGGQTPAQSGDGRGGGRAEARSSSPAGAGGGNAGTRSRGASPRSSNGRPSGARPNRSRRQSRATRPERGGSRPSGGTRRGEGKGGERPSRANKGRAKGRRGSSSESRGRGEGRRGRG